MYHVCDVCVSRYPIGIDMKSFSFDKKYENSFFCCWFHLLVLLHVSVFKSDICWLFSFSLCLCLSFLVAFELFENGTCVEKKMFVFSVYCVCTIQSTNYATGSVASELLIHYIYNMHLTMEGFCLCWDWIKFYFRFGLTQRNDAYYSMIWHHTSETIVLE